MFKLVDFRRVQAVSPKLSSTLENLLDEYADLLNQKLGNVRDMKATLYVRLGAQFGVHKARQVKSILSRKSTWDSIAT